jgi:hypothetical protein
MAHTDINAEERLGRYWKRVWYANMYGGHQNIHSRGQINNASLKLILSICIRALCGEYALWKSDIENV